MSADPIQHAADALRRAHRAVAFTGAGISVPSGIPDYRSREGLWERDDPMVVASYSNFRRDHTQFYAWFRKTMTSMGDARPNVAHHALVELQRMGHLAAVITQNIDGLHSRAGNDPVYELHGHLRTMTCLKCYANCTSAPYIAQLLDTGDVPTCAACGSVLKPDIIMFGEQLPIATLQAARAAAHQADLILVAGTSLEVTPASDIVAEAMRRATPIIIIDLQRTLAPSDTVIPLQGDVARLLPAILERMKQ